MTAKNESVYLKMHMELTSNINWNQELYLVDLFKLLVEVGRFPSTFRTVFSIVIPLESLSRFKTLSKTKIYIKTNAQPHRNI